MPKKDKDSHFIIIGDVKLKVSHEKKLDRTTLFMYIKLPKGFGVVLKDVTTTPDNRKMVKNANRNTRERYQVLRKKIKEGTATPNEKQEFESIKNQSNSNWKKQEYQTVFEFCVIDIDGDDRTEYLEYQLPGADHNVNVNIKACDDIDIPDGKLKILVDYQEVIN